MKIVWIIASYIVALFPVGWLINAFLSRYELEIELEKGLKNAGKYIGLLERFLIVTLVWAGEISAVGFVIAAKSVFRFGEIKDKENRKLAEYILIGTLASFSLALAIAYIFRWISVVGKAGA
ncbi:MAG: hypothetical protein PHN82_06385 [bacterium]|nr:hypothetical protein [bacterium]